MLQIKKQFPKGKRKKERKEKMENKKEIINIYSNESLKENLEMLENMGYKYIVKANDKFLSGWGNSGVNGHIQLIASKDWQDAEAIIYDLEKDKGFNYIDYQLINNYKNINNYTRYKSFTIRNDWTRHLRG